MSPNLISGLALDPVKNFGKVTVSTGYTSAALSIVLNPEEGVKLPDPSVSGWYNLVWWDSTDYADPSDDPNVEIVRVTSNIANTLGILRGQEGTLASNKNTPGKTYKMILSPTKKTVDDIQTDAQTKVNTHTVLTSTHGVLGNIVGTTDVQTLTNKIISGNNNTISNIDFETSIKQSTLYNQSFQNLLKNGNFEFWSAGPTTAPDRWTLNGGTIIRDGINKKIGTYAVAGTSSPGTDFSLNQYIITSNLSIDYLRGRTLTFGCWIKASVTPVQIQIRDGVGVSGGIHSGGGNWEFVTVTRIIDPAASGIDVNFYIQLGTKTAYFDGAILVEGSIVPAFMPHPFDTVLVEPRLKVGNFTHDISTVSGTQPITGIGFKPSGVTFIMAIINASTGATGFMDSAGNQGNVEYKQTDLWQTSSSYCLIGRNPGFADYSYGSYYSMDSDGFTISWAKSGSPTGILNITYMAHR